MPITDPLVLPVDVRLTPLAALTTTVRTRLRARDGEYTITRPRGRAHAKLVSAEGAALLQEFRTARRIVDVIAALADRRGVDPDGMLRDAFPLLRKCVQARFLVPADSPEAAAILPSRERGDRIGRFTVLRSLNVKDDTELYQARDHDGTLAAVKLVRPGTDVDVRKKLTREAAALLRLDGAGSPALLARGRHRRRAWIAMTWCEGVPPSLLSREFRSRDGHDARAHLLRLGVSIARAYARLHRNGILHGDVHPDNVLVGRRGEVRLVDFGLAQGIPPVRLPGTAASGGVAPFLSPEYALAWQAGRAFPPPDPASEQYSVAALLYQLICGRPYADFAITRSEMLEQILTEPPLPFAARHSVPWPPVEDILARAFRKNPDERFPSVAALARALAAVPPPRPVGRRSERRAPIRARVDEFLTRVRIGGVAFPAKDEVPSTAPLGSVQHGGAGVAYTLYRIAVLRNDPDLLASADAWLCRTEQAATSPLAFADPGTELEPAALGPVSLFHSPPGMHLVRVLVANAMSDRRAARSAVARYVEGSRVPWEGLDLTIGRAGILLGCSILVEALGDAARAETEALRALADDTLRWLWRNIEHFGPVGRSQDFPELGAAHGWAGLLHASLRWHAATGQPSTGLLSRLDELAACAESRGRGLVWRGVREAVSDEKIAGWCRGPSGFIHLWTLAHRCFRDPGYLRLAEGAAWSTWDHTSGVPDLCCGLTGRAYGLLSLYRHTGRTEWLDRARVLGDRAARLIGRWPAALARPLSLFKAVPGVILLVEDLEHPETAAMPLIDAEGWPAPAEGR